jgi:rubrerythrin
MAMSERVLGRRDGIARLIAAAGLAPSVLAFLREPAVALPRGEETDVAVLRAALAIEHEAIAVYDAGLKRRLFPLALQEYAVEFRGDHLGHRDTQIALLEERGDRAPAPQPRYDWGRIENGDQMVRLACDIERTAQRAYTALLSQIRSDDYTLSAAFILIDEVRHLTIWRRTLGQALY